MKRSIIFDPFVVLGFVAFFYSFEASASSLAIRTHLTEATELNYERTPLYAELTANKSLLLSQELILMENLAKIATLHLDLQAIPYFNKGVGLFHDDLIDMRLTPSFSETFPNEDSPKNRVEIETKTIKKRWLNLIKGNELQTAYEEAIILLDEGVLKERNQNCLTRHFVESIARGLMNLESHREKSEALGLRDPRPILLAFIKLQIHSLTWTKRLDRKAFPIQARGVPLFCQDVPPIPYK